MNAASKGDNESVARYGLPLSIHNEAYASFETDGLDTLFVIAMEAFHNLLVTVNTHS
jgi:hypothetical protein